MLEEEDAILMGVLRCSRGDCENVMCDRVSHNYGYICNECFEELIQWILQGNQDIQDFMGSLKSKNTLFTETRIRKLLEKEFPIR
jgi:hypothetical protein